MCSLVAIVAAVVALLDLELRAEWFSCMVEAVNMKSIFDHFIRVMVVVKIHDNRVMQFNIGIEFSVFAMKGCDFSDRSWWKMVFLFQFLDGVRVCHFVLI